MTTDLTTAARRILAEYTPLTSLLGASDSWDTWIFRWRPYVTLKASGSAAIVLSERGGWATPNRHNTARFPRLQVEVYVDVPREEGSPVSRIAEERALEICRAVDEVLHVPDGAAMDWADLRVIGSTRQSEPQVDLVPDADGLVRALAYYEICLG